ncbi:MAG: ISAs1 family transposase, partial [Pseudomonadota bacterium]
MERSESLLNHMDLEEDTRVDSRCKRHLLQDIIAITALATSDGATTWTEISAFGQKRSEWLRLFLALPNGAPSEDTFSRVFSLFEPKEFEDACQAWLKSLPTAVQSELAAGESICELIESKAVALPLNEISVWDASDQVILGQVKTEEPESETIEGIAIPQLLKVIDCEEAILTVDSAEYQAPVAKELSALDAQYILTLKEENQSIRYNAVASLFAHGEKIQYKKLLNKRKLEKVRYGEILEKRRYTIISDRDQLLSELRWPGLRSVGMLERSFIQNNEVTKETHFYLTSIFDDVNTFLCGFWKQLDVSVAFHWFVGVSFSDGEHKVRDQHA